MSSDRQQREALDGLFVDDPVSASLAQLVSNLVPGSRLPSERALAARLHVSRTALRDRLAILEGMGVLHRRAGSGAYVEALQPDALTLPLSLAINSSHMPLAALESVRIALERQAAREAARQADPVLIAHMRRALNAMAEHRDVESFAEADQVFHQSLLRAAGNPALTFFADALRGVLSRNVKRRLHALGATLADGMLVVEPHRRIYESVLEGDMEGSMKAIDAHFQIFEDLLHKAPSSVP